MSFLSILGVVLGLGYLLLMGILRIFWTRIKVESPTPNYLPQTSISVVVSAKNEAKNIANLVHHLLAQKYPSHLVEFLIVDDHSVDDTMPILELQNLPENFYLLQAIGHGKKSAITQAVNLATGKLIVTTDADCIMGDIWLQSIAWQYEAQKPKFMASPVQFYGESSLLERFQSLDFLGMMLVTGVGISQRWFYMANGANMAFEKAAFLAVKGYQGNETIASGDDMFLINKIAKHFLTGSIIFNTNLHAVVRTKAASTWRGFVRQRVRWGGKNKASDDLVLKIVLGWVFLTSVWLLLFPFVRFWVYVLLMKLIGDYVLLRSATAYFGRKKLMMWFLPSFVLHTLYLSVIGTWSLFAKGEKWK